MAVVQVLGSNSDWITPIEDCVYTHIKQKWLISDPPVTDFDSDNKAWDDFGQIHLYVQRVSTAGDRDTVDNSIWNYVSLLKVHVVMKRLTMGQLPTTMQNASTECQRIFIMYSPYWIAGISEFNNIREEVIDEPDTPANPFKNTWHIALFVNAFYQKGTDFAISSAPYNPSLWTAGQLTYL